MDYKHTIRLPKTNFPMKADLPQREPNILSLWEKESIYDKLLEARKNGTEFVLHDGPPFANGDAHMGHALNMTLKDIVLKSRNMLGFRVPFVPGWDCHGLPIEHKVVQEMDKEEAGSGTKADPASLRKRCEAYANKYIDIQRRQFKRLGVFGAWDKPYLTMDPAYEAEELRVLATLVEKKLVYEGLRPVLWSTGCRTALAEAEVEYQEKKDTAVYVAFRLNLDSSEKLGLSESAEAYLLIWTTTPWTLPANLAVAVNPKLSYTIAESKGRFYVCGTDRVEALEKLADRTLHRLRTVKGEELVGLMYDHPFLGREGKVYPADFVTEESGTGLVHIAPGHGHDDYHLGQKYGLGILSPVDDTGKLTEECGVPSLTGLYVFKANEPIRELLAKVGALWASEEYLHSYPHCWRSKTPIIFRCVKQWFIAVDNIRQDALDAIEKVKWVPSWGINRIRGAVESRPDWCISRQRTWGVPIPVFYDHLDHPILTPENIRKVADIVEKEGTNVWFSTPAEEMAKRIGLSIPREGLRKGTDTLDVWIDSGTSHTAVVRKSLRFPADLYLEGSDQHRGWFQSSLMTSVAVYNEPPYNEVLTNGFVVDIDGKKLSKSNAQQKPVGLMDFVEKYGADILRLWVASEDYREDVPFSDEIFKRVMDTYRLLRNTLRILLGNLDGFDPKRDSVPAEKWTSLDLYIFDKLQTVVTKIGDAYKTYDFHVVYHTLNRFCAVDLSSFYIDILKDRIYCDHPSSVRRRSAQTVMHEIVETLCKLLAPLIPFTSEEAWQEMARWDGQKLARPSIHLEKLPEPKAVSKPENLDQKWEKILKLRGQVNEELEKARQAKELGKSLEAVVEIESSDFTQADAELLEEALIVSQVKLIHGSETKIKVRLASGKKCTRCWKHLETVGSHPNHPDLCPRCADVVEKG